MTGEPNPKKLKINSELETDARVNITTSQEASYDTLVEDGFFFIELQGEKSINKKLNKMLNTGDEFILLKDFPEENMYKGYLCNIISVLNADVSPEKSFYEIQFDSCFEDNDLSRKSQKRHRDFEYPSSVYVTIVSGEDIVRLIKQDLLYKTWFA